MISEGDPAPDFDLPRDGGGTIKLSDFKGKIVVLYFYPKDDTSGCTKEAVDFTEKKDAFDALGAEIIGISPDPVKAHDKFKAKHDLQLILGADEEKTTLEAYGVWAQKQMYGKTYMGVERSTFLIDADGQVARVWRKVKVPGHAEAVLAAAQDLKGN
jgi:peroxiredoxin Q/BCP